MILFDVFGNSIFVGHDYV